MKPEIKNFKVDEKSMEASFELYNVPVEFANTLRRIMISEVPTLAIEYVLFRKNDSVMYDEFLAHRLGLIPIKTDLNKFDFLENHNISREEFEKAIMEGKLEKIPKECYAKFELNLKGPCTVYAKDLKPLSGAEPAIKEIPIVKLGKNEELKLEAYAILGQGKEHIKWSPVTACYYIQKDNKIEFYFGYDGSLDPKEIVLRALDILKFELKSLKSLL